MAVPQNWYIDNLCPNLYGIDSLNLFFIHWLSYDLPGIFQAQYL